METIEDGEVARLRDFDNRERVARLLSGRPAAQSLPVIDFAAEPRSVARDLRAACTDTGFFYLVDHGISAAEFEVAHDWGRLFFALPREVKAGYAKTRHPAGLGWMPVGGTAPEANPDKDADQKETFVLARERLPGEEPKDARIGQSQWPDPALMPGFRDFISAHILKRVAVAQRLCRALALSLDLPQDWFDEAHRYPTSSLTYNYYPALDPAAAGRTQWGISPHTDYASFTLLSQDASGGLEVRRGETWIDVPPLEGAFVVNIADLFQRWTNGVYKSSLHRASNFRLGGRARISLPLFFGPHPATRIECLPTCAGPDNPPKYEPVEAGAYTRALLEQSYRTGRPGVAQRTVEERLTRL